MNIGNCQDLGLYEEAHRAVIKMMRKDRKQIKKEVKQVERQKEEERKKLELKFGPTDNRVRIISREFASKLIDSQKSQISNCDFLQLTPNDFPSLDQKAKNVTDVICSTFENGVTTERCASSSIDKNVSKPTETNVPSPEPMNISKDKNYNVLGDPNDIDMSALGELDFIFTEVVPKKPKRKRGKRGAGSRKRRPRYRIKYDKVAENSNNNNGINLIDSDELNQPGFTELIQSASRELNQPGFTELIQSASKELNQSGSKDLNQSGFTELIQSASKELNQCGSKELNQSGFTELIQSASKELNQCGSKELNQPGFTELIESASRELNQCGSKELNQSGFTELIQSASNELNQSGFRKLIQFGFKELNQSVSKDITVSEDKELNLTEAKEPNLSRLKKLRPQPIRFNLSGRKKSNLYKPTDLNIPGPNAFNLSQPKELNLSGPIQFNVYKPDEFNIPGPNEFDLSQPTELNLPGPNQSNLYNPEELYTPGPNELNLSEPKELSIPGPSKFNSSVPKEVNLSEPNKQVIKKTKRVNFGPVTVNILDIIQKSRSQLKKEELLKRESDNVRQRTRKFRQREAKKTERYEGNVLDASQPDRQRGKHREFAKEKKPSKLKQLIQRDAAAAEEEAKEEEDESEVESFWGKPKYSEFHINYSNNVITPELDSAVTAFLTKIVQFQENLYERDQIKGDTRRRYFVGFKVVRKFLLLKKIKILIVSPDIKAKRRGDTLDNMINNIVSLAAASEIPYVFALSRRKLGQITLKNVPICCVAVADCDGTEKEFEKVLQLIQVTRAEYQKTKPLDAQEEQTKEIIDDFLSFV